MRSSNARSLLLLTLAGSLSLSGCSWFGFGKDDEFKPRGPALGQVIRELPELELPSEPPAAPSQEEVLAAYEKVYGRIPDLGDNLAVGKRLADLKMDRGEQADIEGAQAPYADAVTLYQSLLEQSDAALAQGEEAAGRDQILYQLARAHDIQGQGEASVAYLDRLIRNHPDSIYIVEAHFRRAESAFSQGSYRQAADDYGVVVAAGTESPFWQNANYMRGWSLFKQSDLEPGLLNFFAVIDGLVGATRSDGPRTMEELAATDRELLDDSLRVVTLALGYLDGAQTLAQQMRDVNKPTWQYLVYQRLADDHVDKERFLDSVATWQTFVDENPLDLRAPNAHQGMIDTLVAADFPSEIQPKKEEYVRRYGVRSEFWQVHAGEDRSSYLPTLKTYLKELAAISHSAAQQLAASKKRGRNHQQAVRTAYLAAADWYEQTVETFPEDVTVADQLFLLGEVYTEAAEPARAVAAYQRLLREFPEHEKAAESGYAAVLGLTALLATAADADQEQRARLAQQKIDAQVEFALLFPGDKRAPAVQTDAADSLFKLGRFEESIQLAETAFATWSNLTVPMVQTNLLILGHGNFELGQYAGAENAYHRYLATDLSQDQRLPVAEKLLASVYKQAEEAETGEQPEAAIAHFQRMQQINFDAELTIQGQYDAIAIVEGQQQLQRVAGMLGKFREDYPQHQLAQGIDMRMAGLYEQTENFAAAAQEYVNVSRSNSDPEVARQSLYRAAQLYLEQQDLPKAQTYFADYVQRYPEPLDLNLEAVHQLDTFAVQRGDESARLGWLDRKIRIHKRMGRNASERATYLAADAQFVFANRERARFSAVALTRPLAKSLKSKTKALKSTVAAYEAVAGYKVQPLASASTFEIADLYAELARAVMGSQRPANLSALEMEQYDLLLEEQAFPFEEQAISLHEINMQRSWDGVYDEWVQKSFVALRKLMPARFDKQERQIAYFERIH